MAIRSQKNYWLSALSGAVVLLAQTAYVKDKVRRISIKQIHRLDNFYLQLKRDQRGIASVPSVDRLRVQYESLVRDCGPRLGELKKEKDLEQARLSQALRTMAPGQTESQLAENFSQAWANLFFEERTRGLAEQASGKINRSISSVSPNLGSGGPAKINLGINQSTVSVRNFNYIFRNNSGRSDLQLEFGKKVRSTLTYQMDDQVILWSLSTGF